MTELQLVNLEHAIQNIQGHPVLAIVGGMLSVALWVYGRERRAAKKR